MSSFRAVLLVCLGLFVPVALVGQQAQEPGGVGASGSGSTSASGGAPIPTLHVTEREVVLDVTVTDGHGRSIKGLKASDFKVFDDGVPQTLRSFSEHVEGGADILPEATSSEALARSEVTKTVIVFDLQPFTVTGYDPETAASVKFVHDEMVRFLKTLAPGSPLSIFKIDWQGLHLVHDLTTSPKALQEVIDAKDDLPPLGFAAHPGDGRESDRQLENWLAGLSGRVNLVWFGGLPHFNGEHGPFADVSQFVSDARGGTNVLRLSRMVPYLVDANGLRAPTFSETGYWDMHLEDWLPDMGLQELAENAGGKMFFNNNGFGQMVQEVVSTGSNYYTLSYSPTNVKWDGTVRSVKINVSNDLLTAQEKTSERINDVLGGNSTRILYRHAYIAGDAPGSNAQEAQQRLLGAPGASSADWDAQGEQSLNKLARAKAIVVQSHVWISTRLSAAAMNGPNSLHFRTTLNPAENSERTKPGGRLPEGNFVTAAYRSSPTRNYVVHISIAPQDLKIERASVPKPAGDHMERMIKYLAPLEFDTVILARDGSVVNSVATSVQISFDDLKKAEEMARSGVGLDQVIAVPSGGDFELRTDVSNVRTGQHGMLKVAVNASGAPRMD